LIVASVEPATLRTIFSQYKKVYAIYWPTNESYLTIILADVNNLLVISATLNCSWNALAVKVTIVSEQIGKWIREYGTKLVWN
jgi:hypothetical protein